MIFIFLLNSLLFFPTPFIYLFVQPFGHGVAMVLVPTVHSGDSRVFIWNRTNVATPVCTLTGHSEAVVDVQWRKLERGQREREREREGKLFNHTH